MELIAARPPTQALPASRGGIAGRLGRHRELWCAISAAVLSLAVGVWALRLWQADLTVPLRYSVADDTKFYLMLIKGIVDHGWFLTNHSLGAPFGQQLLDFPQTADSLNFVLLAAIAVPFSQIGLVINLFFLITLPLDGTTAYLVLRRLGVSQLSSIVCAVLFAALPYHFFRIDSHLFLSSYYALPLIAYLFLRLVGGEPLFARRQRAGGVLRVWASRRTASTALLCFVIASTGLYYAVFGLVLLVSGTLLVAVARRGRGVVVGGAVACVVVGMILAINLSPTFVYEAVHGTNRQVQHDAEQGDDLALSASYLVLPPVHDRITPLRHLTERYFDETTPPNAYCEQCYESIGTVGDVGFLWLVAIAFATIVSAPLAARTRPVQRHAAAAIAICLAVGVTGGVSSLTRVFITSDIRAWNRLSVLIAFFSLFAVGMLLDALSARMRTRSRTGAALLGVLMPIVLLFGVADQTSGYFVPNYRADREEYRSDATFVKAIERRLPAGSEIFQLPYVPFPEGYQPYLDPGQTLPYSSALNYEYEEVREYLHSSDLRWSYGAMKGRAADWSAQLAAKPLNTAIAGVTAAGFHGIVIDARGYPGQLGTRLQSELRSLLHTPPVTSPDSDLVFYDLRPYARRLRAQHSVASLHALRQAVLHPLRLTCTTGRLSIVNPDRTANMATVTARLTAVKPTEIRLVATGGSTFTTVAGPRGTFLRYRLRLPPGDTTVTTFAHDPEAALVALHAPTVTDSAFGGFPSGGISLGILGPPCVSMTPLEWPFQPHMSSAR